jgi:predicted ArsR family transcriptional regulator
VTDREHGLAALGTLAEPLRRRVYVHVCTQAAPVSRDGVAAALDIPRSVAAFHLDKLADVGLLDVDFARPPGRGGPGAGRPAKWYRPREGEVALSVPERHYEVAAAILARALAESIGGDVPSRRALRLAARNHGQALATELSATAGAGPASPRRLLERLSQCLTASGYEPEVDHGVVRLRNCPFRRLADAEAELVCSMNLDLIRGILEGIGEPALSARLDPGPGRCCVTVRAS